MPIESLAAWLESAAHPAIEWHMPAVQHVTEFLVFSAVIVTLLTVAWVRLHPARRPDDRHDHVRVHHHHAHRHRRSPASERVLVGILMACFAVTLAHKWLRSVMPFMLMPCHLTTAMYLAAYASTSLRAARVWFNLAVMHMFFTLLAIAVPDTSLFTLPGEVVNFWVHHWILFAVPLYWLMTDRFPLFLDHRRWTVLSIALGTIFFWWVHLPASFLSGINVNYMVKRPPKLPPGLDDDLYRWKFFPLLAGAGIACRYIVAPLFFWLGHKVGTLPRASLHRYHSDPVLGWALRRSVPDLTQLPLDEPPFQTVTGETSGSNDSDSDVSSDSGSDGASQSGSESDEASFTDEDGFVVMSPPMTRAAARRAKLRQRSKAAK